jgi:hypothetical protein
MKIHSNVKLLEIDLDNKHFTGHGQHLNLCGKEITFLKLAMITGQVYKRNQLASFYIQWKDRNAEEGRKSPSQESGLNRELAGNNNQCNVISVSDSVASTGGKEGKSEREGNELQHRASKRTKKNNSSRYGDFFYGHHS